MWGKAFRNPTGPTAIHSSLCGATSVGKAEVVSTQSESLRFNFIDINSLQQDDQLSLLSRELRQLGIELVALSEVTRSGSSTISVGYYTYYSGCCDGHYLQEVAINIFGKLQLLIVEVTPVYECIMALSLHLASWFLLLCTLYIYVC